MTDLISRQAAVEALKKHRELYCDNTPDTFSKLSYAEKSRVSELDMAIATLVNLPSAEPERKKGEWLELTNSNHTFVCSACGRMLVNITDGKNTVTINYPFCHCGADMRGEKE